MQSTLTLAQHRAAARDPGCLPVGTAANRGPPSGVDSRRSRLTSPRETSYSGRGQIPTDASIEAERTAVDFWYSHLLQSICRELGNLLSRLVETSHELNQSSTTTGARDDDDSV